MYAVIQTCGRQYKVKKGDTLRVELLPEAIGETKSFTEVLLVGEGAGVKIGQPFVADAVVKAEIVGIEKGPKIEILHRKRRKQFKRHVGHRQPYSRVLITEVSGDALTKAEREAILKRVGFVRFDEYAAQVETAESKTKLVEKQKARVAKAKTRTEGRLAKPAKKKAGAKKKAAAPKAKKSAKTE